MVSHAACQASIPLINALSARHNRFSLDRFNDARYGWLYRPETARRRTTVRFLTIFSAYVSPYCIQEYPQGNECTIIQI